MAIGDLRQNNEFTDMTLAYEDGEQVEAHNVVLVASSPFFKRNKHHRPLIYMRDVRPENLMAKEKFVYLGEENVYQENLDDFFCFGRRASAERPQRKPNCKRVRSDFAANKPESPSQIPKLLISAFHGLMAE